MEKKKTVKASGTFNSYYMPNSVPPIAEIPDNPKQRIYWYLITGLIVAGFLQWMGWIAPVFISDKVKQEYRISTYYGWGDSNNTVLEYMGNGRFRVISGGKKYTQIVDRKCRLAKHRFNYEKSYYWEEEVK